VGIVYDMLCTSTQAVLMFGFAEINLRFLTVDVLVYGVASVHA